MSSISCKYKGTSRAYTFHCPGAILSTLKKGDNVVVEDVHGLSIVKVTSTCVKPYGEGERNVICRIDTEGAEQYKAQQLERVVILEALEAKAIEASKLVVYQNLRTADPEVDALLKRLEAI